MDYFKTLNIFKSPIDQKAKLLTLEEKINQYYQKIDLSSLITQKNLTHQKNYYLLDGPPYANGEIHIGHALNKILKDIVLRYQFLNGKKIQYLPGWDCHGLPIEQKVKEKIKFFDLETFFKNSLNYVEEQITTQKKQFLKLGLINDFKNYYRTIDQEYISLELEFFKILVKEKLIYRDLRPIYWSWSSQTVLSDAEVEYQNKLSHSLYFLAKISNFLFQNKDVFFIVWTTTPWSILGNQGLAINEKFQYCLVKDDERCFILNKNLIKTNPIFKNFENKILKTFKIEEILNFTYFHPINNNIYCVYPSLHVVEEEGTGFVHIAPGHGEDDFLLGKKYQLNIFSVIDDHGKIHSVDEDFNGLFYEKASKEIIQQLKEKNLLFLEKSINHSYPHDWRTKKPVVYLVKEQWFIDIEKFKPQIIETIQKVNFFATSGKEKLISMIKARKSWCISRQRKWGVPIPILFDDQLNKPILDLEIINQIIEVISQKGILFWFNADINQILSKESYQKLLEKHSSLRKETDILDVWFDSGTAFLSYLKYFQENNLKIDLIVEGNDQFRGWFNSSLILATIWNANRKEKINFTNILSHGFVLDQKGHKMSKSLNNIIVPDAFLKDHGIDILRLWITSSDVFVDVRLGSEIVKVIKSDYQKIRNTLRFLIANLVDFDYKQNHTTKFEEVDEYILFELQNLKENYLTNFENFNFTSNLKLLKNFLSTILSAFYLNFSKDIIYIEEQNALRRRQIQTVFYYILDHFLLFLAPVLVYTCEEIYQVFNKLNKKKTIFEESFQNLKLLQFKLDRQKWNQFHLFRKALNKALEQAKKNNLIKVWQEAEVSVDFKDDNFYKIKTISNLKQILTIRELKFVENSEVNDQFIEIENCYFQIKNQPKIKCLRCWKYFFETEMVNDICNSCHKIVNSKQN